VAATLSLSAAGAGAEDALTQLLRTNACVGCDLSEADLRRYDLTEANLENADLRGANLNRTNLTRADLSGADLRHAYLVDTNFQGANLNSADLHDAYLLRTDLTGASLYATNFGEAYLEEVSFVNAVLMRFADLSDVVFTSADFEGAALCGAIFDFGEYRHGCLE
jgi:uncharacterized protein YjbI with pentapeptide repeats